MFVISDNGPYDAQGDSPTSGHMVSLLYQPQAMRWRGVTVMTNTPPRSAQSSPGGLQGIAIIEPIIAKAARKLAVDQLAIRYINCPEGKAQYGPPVDGKLQHATSAFLEEALQRGSIVLARLTLNRSWRRNRLRDVRLSRRTRVPERSRQYTHRPYLLAPATLAYVFTD